MAKKKTTFKDMLRDSFPVDMNGLLSRSSKEEPIDTVTVSDTVIVSIPTQLPEPSPPPSDLLLTISHYALTTTPRMTDWEARIYRYLVERAYDTEAASGQVYYRQRSIMKDLGLTSPPTVSRSMRGLERRGLIRWIKRARGRGETSKLKVNLPPE